MRTMRLAMAGVVLVALSGGIGAGAAEPSQTEVAWATIRDGVYADRAEWEARLAAFDPEDEEQVRELRRLVRDQLALLADFDLDEGSTPLWCAGEARAFAEMASREIEGVLTEFLTGDRRLGEELLPYVQQSEALHAYWDLRDEVDCSTAAEVAAFLGPPYDFRPVSGRRLGYDYVSSEEEVRFEDGAARVDGDTTYERWEWSDPLLPSDLTNRMNMANFGAGWEGRVIVGSMLLEGPEGYWTGTGYGHFVDPEGPFGHGLSLLEGHGVYEGLSAVLTSTADTDADTLTVEGAIYSGPLPSLPEPLVPAE